MLRKAITRTITNYNKSIILNCSKRSIPSTKILKRLQSTAASTNLQSEESTLETLNDKPSLQGIFMN